LRVLVQHHLRGWIVMLRDLFLTPLRKLLLPSFVLV